MKMKFTVLDRIFESFLVLPLTLGGLSLLFAQGMIQLDSVLQAQGILWTIGTEISVEGGRSILVAIAGSVLGVAATSFSITTSVLATASSTYGPRLVRNFMNDRRNQFILGSFGASFLYALSVLRALRGEDHAQGVFIPSLSIDIALVLGVLNVALLIYFIQHISHSIQISSLISRVRDDLLRSVSSLYLENQDEKNDDIKRAAPELPSDSPYVVYARSDGYVSYLDIDAMAARAQKMKQTVKVLIQPGDYIYKRQPIIYVWNEEDVDDESLAARWTHDHFATSITRSPLEDIRYAIQQPIDITVRAMSPGTNDPYTAINALHGLGSGMVRLVSLHNIPSVVYDDTGIPRVFKHTITIEHIIESTFRTLRSNVIGSVDATLAVLDMADKLLIVTDMQSYRNIIIKAVGSIQDAFMDSSAPGQDKQIIKNASDQVIQKHSKSDATSR